MADRELNAEDVEIVDRQWLYRGFFKVERFSLRHRLFAGGWGPKLQRELFVRGEAVAAVLYDPRRDLIGMVEQFRIGALAAGEPPWCKEVVAGMTEQGEEPEQVIVRELQEEAGVVPERLEYICNYLSSPGGSDEKLHLYCALADLTEVGGIHGLEQEGEDIRVEVLAAQQVFDAMLGGEYNNAASIICLQWLMLNRQRLRAG